MSAAVGLSTGRHLTDRTDRRSALTGLSPRTVRRLGGRLRPAVCAGHEELHLPLQVPAAQGEGRTQLAGSDVSYGVLGRWHDTGNMVMVGYYAGIQKCGRCIHRCDIAEAC